MIFDGVFALLVVYITLSFAARICLRRCRQQRNEEQQQARAQWNNTPEQATSPGALPEEESEMIKHERRLKILTTLVHKVSE